MTMINDNWANFNWSRLENQTSNTTSHQEIHETNTVNAAAAESNTIIVRRGHRPCNNMLSRHGLWTTSRG